nr:hypothetical protein [uncultured bacterium]
MVSGDDIFDGRVSVAVLKDNTWQAVQTNVDSEALRAIMLGRANALNGFA